MHTLIIISLLIRFSMLWSIFLVEKHDYGNCLRRIRRVLAYEQYSRHLFRKFLFSTWTQTLKSLMHNFHRSSTTWVIYASAK